MSSTVICGMKCVVIPNASKSLNKSMVPPNNPLPAMISSPALNTFNSATVMAAIPEAQATAPVPPSTSLILCSNAATVGLPILV